MENPYTFTGREWDAESGLYYYRARHYYAESGRFLSFDPILRGYEHTGTNTCNKSINSLPLNSPQELSPYVYVVGNPINRIDPSGKSVVIVHGDSACSYYGKTCKTSARGCNYACKNAPILCRGARSLPNLLGVSNNEIDCIRGCLIKEDKRARSHNNNFTKPCSGCLKNQVIDRYHITCYERCGVGTWRYPGVGPLGNNN